MNTYPSVRMPEHPRSHKGSKVVLNHIIVAERALGKCLPDGAEVHHVNEIKTDYRNCNLVICESKAYHKMLHARMRILKIGGNPDTDKICCRCKCIVLRSKFCKDSSSPDGLSARCPRCEKEKKRSGNKVPCIRQNRHDTKFIKMPDGTEMSITDAARVANISYRLMYDRLFKYDIPIATALTGSKLKTGPNPDRAKGR